MDNRYKTILVFFLLLSLGLVVVTKDVTGQSAGGCIEGHKVDDQHRYLSGWVIYTQLLDGSGPVYSCSTDSKGYFVFDNLPFGTYRVWEEVVAGWQPITASEFEVTLYQTETCVQTRFKNQKIITTPGVSGTPPYGVTGPIDGGPTGTPTGIRPTVVITGAPGDIPWPDWGGADIFCPVDGDPRGGIRTALGCIPIDYYKFVSWLLTYSLGIGGGIAFLLMVYGGFQVITAKGDFQKVQAGKQLIQSAASGLVLIIFSIFVVRALGIRVFQIPGLS